MTEEMWTLDQVAEHFRVSNSRARAILAEYHVPRSSGYPADRVRAIERPGQGRRTDLKEQQ